jgi:hypothetical protein
VGTVVAMPAPLACHEGCPHPVSIFPRSRNGCVTAPVVRYIRCLNVPSRVASLDAISHAAMSSMESPLIRPTRVLPLLVGALFALWLTAGYLRLRHHDGRLMRRDAQRAGAPVTGRP